MKIVPTSIAVLLIAGICLAGVLPASAQQGADPVLARVDGVEIRESDLELAEADIGDSLPAASPEARRQALVSYLIDVNILANAAHAKKIDEAPDFERRAEFARKKVLMQALLEQETKDAASDAQVKELYEESVKRLDPEEEVRARHILVETEEEAKEVRAKLEAGADFAELAKEHSKDPGGGEGGDLGFFSKQQMVPEFAEAAFNLGKGELSEPVKTQFGWHVIRVDDKREKPVPAFDDVKDQLERYLLQRAQADTVMKAREAATVERLSPPEAPADDAKQN